MIFHPRKAVIFIHLRKIHFEKWAEQNLEFRNAIFTVGNCFPTREVYSCREV